MTENQQHAERVIAAKARRDWLVIALVTVIVVLLGYIVVSYYLAQRDAAAAVANAKTLAQQVAEACEDEAVVVSDQNICDLAGEVAQTPVTPAPGVAPQPAPAVTLRGQDGRDGEDGRDGVDGQDGEPGADGKPGVDGRPGADGDAGSDGADGAAGGQGEPGRPPTAEEISAAVAAYCGQETQPCKGDKGDTGSTGATGPAVSAAEVMAAVQAYCSMPERPCAAVPTPEPTAPPTSE